MVRVARKVSEDRFLLIHYDQIYLELCCLILIIPVIVHPCDNEDNGGCQHVCEKVALKAVCKCNKNFELAQDKKKCNEGKCICLSIAFVEMYAL